VSQPVSENEFNRVAQQHCQRWESRSLAAVRALLIEQVRLSEVAEKFGMKPQQVTVLRSRFLERMRREAAVKLPAEQFMQQVRPERASVLDPFRNDLRQLVKRGYALTQIGDFLQANNVKVPIKELRRFVEAMNEKVSSSEPKRRRR